MKTVLSPVDFSENSRNALSFAAEMSKRAKADLVIFHALSSEKEEAIVLEKLTSLEKELKQEFGDSISCRHHMEHGQFTDAIATALIKLQPDITVMGTRGISDSKGIFIGSNTVNVIKKNKYPVLIIPEAARFENFAFKGKGKVVLATDLKQLKNTASLNIVKEIALMLIEPTVRVMSVRPEGTHLRIVEQLHRDELLSFFNPELESKRITVFSDDVIAGINYYLSEKADVGMVAMVAKDSGMIFQKHYTREMAAHTNMPLLVVHDTE